MSKYFCHQCSNIFGFSVKIFLPSVSKHFCLQCPNIFAISVQTFLPSVSKYFCQKKGDWKGMEPVRKHWHWVRRLERKSRNAETLFNAFIVFKAFNKLHCLYCPSLPSLSFCAFYILQCPSVQKAELWALRACLLFNPCVSMFYYLLVIFNSLNSVQKR